MNMRDLYGNIKIKLENMHKLCKNAKFERLTRLSADACRLPKMKDRSVEIDRD